MKKRILTIIMVVVVMMTISFVGCGKQMVKEDELETNTSYSMFIEVENGRNYKVIYHKDTKVMYTISDGGYNCGTFTLLVNSDGTPMLYEK